MVRTKITSKGQTTIPSVFRKKWKTSQIIWEINPDGSAIVRPVPDVMDLFGAAGSPQPKDRDEREQAHDAIAEDAEARPATR